MNDVINEAIYKAYFGHSIKEEDESTAVSSFRQRLYADEKAARIHTNETVTHREYNVQLLRHVADDNIDDVEQLAEILKKLCNAAWGPEWGELSPDLKKGEDSANVIVPQITLDINTRDIAEGMGGLKPTLVDIIQEDDEEGNPTGDAFLVYRQWFDCIVEFDIYGRTNQEARKLQKRFENLVSVYSGYLKRNGVSEIFFSKEVSPKSSLNYDESIPMRCIYYYIRFESITPIRQSLINSINVDIGANKVTADKVKTLIESSVKSDIIELDFFNGDSGITYNSEKL